MSWPRLKVSLVGREPVEVQTNAIDHAPIPVDPHQPKGLDFLFHLAHNALVRTGADVPRHYAQFLEVLDDVPDSVDDDEDMLNPTPPALSDTPQSQSQSESVAGRKNGSKVREPLSLP